MGWNAIADIYKIAALCIRNKKLLVARNKGEQVFFALGGRIEAGETELECLQREVMEETGCTALNPVHFATFEGMNHDNTKTLKISCYFCELEGEIKPKAEIEEIVWIERNYQKKLAQMLELHIVPALVKKEIL